MLAALGMGLVVLAVLGGCEPPAAMAPGRCSDGTRDERVGEECDDAGESAVCNRDCTLARCGDGQVNTAAEEVCDDGNEVNGDGCSAECRREYCGNGIVDLGLGEQCDDSGPSAWCDNDCTLAVCGDSVVNMLSAEACDEGGVDTPMCNRDCTVPVCGDGIINLEASEECETKNDSFFCDGDCTLAWCGDGRANAAAGEECEDGNADDSDWCLSSCESASCEDGIRNGDEQGVDCGGSCESCWAHSVVAGVQHTCALTEMGTVRCWGAGGNGQLGYGNTNSIGDDEPPATAGDVRVGGSVVQLAAGSVYTCALMETGTVRCWGFAPAGAGDVDVGGRVVQAAAGGSHGCALMEAGTVRCWGAGWFGQLGYGDRTFIGVPATAGDVDVGGRVVQLVAGSTHTCALMETGTVRCWGYGGAGGLGYGNMELIGDDEVPATAGDVEVGGRVVQLAAGSTHTCALLEMGTVRCWGGNGSGQLGYGNTSDIGDDEAPATAGDVDVGGRVVQIAAGSVYTCALMETGAVRCWGSGQDGQLGYGNTSNIGDDEAPATAGDVDVGGRVVQLAAGGHTCARMETGAVRCWGSGQDGQLGYGNTSNIGDNETPAAAGDVAYR